MADPDIIFARQIAVDVPDPPVPGAQTPEDWTPAIKAQQDADIMLGRLDDAWSIQAIAEAVRRGRAQARAEFRAQVEAQARRITFLEAAVQPFANAASIISTFWDDGRFILRNPESGRVLISYRDVRMAARSVGLPASVEEAEGQTK